MARYPDLDTLSRELAAGGESKWRTYIAAVQPGAVAHMPVRAVLRQQRAPVELVWSP